jgi:Ran GTPase-activating protein (RanGAP) involved in mRNA processing and transport
MGGKKKGGKKGKKGKVPEEPDESTEKLARLYKKKCSELEAPYSKTLKEKFAECEEDSVDLTKIHLWEELGWQGVKALMDALIHIDYKHTFSLRLWKTYCEDEGVRHICYWLA